MLCCQYLHNVHTIPPTPPFLININPKSQDSKCVLERVSKIANCKIFQNLNICSECISGYFLNANTCDPVASISNCLKYSGVTGECIECLKEFFLTPGNTLFLYLFVIVCDYSSLLFCMIIFIHEKIIIILQNKSIHSKSASCIIPISHP